MLKKIFTGIGIIFCILAIVGSLGFFILNFFESKLNIVGQAYVDDMLPKIVAYWDVGTIISQCDQELLQEEGAKESLGLMFQAFTEKLGYLKEYQGSFGEVDISLTSLGKVTGMYEAQAAFEKADAVIFLTINLNDGNWQISEFRVNSPALLPY